MSFPFSNQEARKVYDEGTENIQKLIDEGATFGLKSTQNVIAEVDQQVYVLLSMGWSAYAWQLVRFAEEALGKQTW